MKIIWIEDFGDQNEPLDLISGLFDDLFPPQKKIRTIFDEEYANDDNKDIKDDLSNLFKENTVHELYLCTCYMEWKEVNESQKGDFDVAIIDINLENGEGTPESEIPIKPEGKEFDALAGLYIYHQLIKSGFPDDNIVFFTAHNKEFVEFQKMCNKAMVEKPKHLSIKNKDEAKIQTWIKKKADDPYLTLRRGIINACNFFEEELKNKTDDELNEFILYFKAANIKLSEDYDGWQKYILDYLTTLKEFFPIKKPNNIEKRYALFLKELTTEWDLAEKAFPRPNPSTIDYKFKENNRLMMKLLRNWSVHNLLTDKFEESDIAYL